MLDAATGTTLKNVQIGLMLFFFFLDLPNQRVGLIVVEHFMLVVAS